MRPTLALLAALALAPLARSGESEAARAFAEAERVTFEVLKNAMWNPKKWLFDMAGSGSGIGLREDGWVLATAHQIKGAKSFTLICPDGIGRRADRWVWSNEMDVGAIHIPDYKVPVARFGRTVDLRVGQTLFAVGRPYGFRLSMTRGIVSGLHRLLTLDGKLTHGFQDYIQTDAEVNAGNSGGPLLNARAEVVGLVCESLSVANKSPGMSYALPSEHVRAFAARLIAEERKVKHAALKIDMGNCHGMPADVRDKLDIRRDAGVVLRNPPERARAAGLRHGDVVTAVNGQPVENWMHLRVLLAYFKPGDPVTLTLARGADIEIALDSWR